MASKQLSELNQLQKLLHYGREQGLLHASLAGIGRKLPGVWHALGGSLTPAAYRRYAKRISPEERLLNLGSGSHRISGAFNVDIDPRADAYVNVTRRLPFPNRAFRNIFCEEVLEHVNGDQGLQMLKECWRILQPGGVCRITTPDLDYFARQALDMDRLGLEMNLIFYGHGHRHIYTEPSLHDAMQKAGFGEIVFSSYRDGQSVLGRHDSHADRFGHPPEIFLYCEAQKPQLE